MAPATDNERKLSKRRIPQQSRSRDLVARILDGASKLVVEGGVDALSTRSIAAKAEVPVASLYQYFADKDEILVALVERDVEEMDAQVAADLGTLETLSVHNIVTTTMRAFVKVFHRRPAFVVIYLRGRTNTAIRDFCRRHNQRVARELYDLAAGIGLLAQDAQPLHAELAVEVGDRVFQIAFEREIRGDARVVDEGIELVTSYLERHATPAGLSGVRT